MSRKKRKLQKQKEARRITLDGRFNKQWMRYFPDDLIIGATFIWKTMKNGSQRTQYTDSMLVTPEMFLNYIKPIAQMEHNKIFKIGRFIDTNPDGFLINKERPYRFGPNKYLSSHTLYPTFVDFINHLILERTILKGRI